MQRWSWYIFHLGVREGINEVLVDVHHSRSNSHIFPQRPESEDCGSCCKQTGREGAGRHFWGSKAEATRHAADWVGIPLCQGGREARVRPDITEAENEAAMEIHCRCQSIPSRPSVLSVSVGISRWHLLTEPS